MVGDFSCLFIIINEELGEFMKAAEPSHLWSGVGLFSPTANHELFIRDWGKWTNRIHFRVWARSRQSGIG